MPGEKMQVSVPVASQTIHQNFMFAGIDDMPDGGRQITFLTANGELHSWPMGEEMSKQVGRKLLAPRVSVHDRIPPEAKSALEANGRS